MTAAWTDVAHVVMSGMSWGSFMMPKIMLVSLAYLVAMLDQREANSPSDGPPWPMIAPFQRA